MKANEVMELYGIHRMTLYRWVKEGKILYEKLPSGRYDYITHVDKYQDKESKTRKTVIYCRVSTNGQKDNLERQIERVKSFTSSRGFTTDAVYSEVASALNYSRRYYRKLFKEIIAGKVERVIAEYKDRILRVGFDDFLELCKEHNTEVIIIDESADKSRQAEIVDDMIFIIHHYSDKMYSNRRRKKLEDAVKEILDTNA